MGSRKDDHFGILLGVPFLVTFSGAMLGGESLDPRMEGSLKLYDAGVFRPSK